MKTVCVYCGSQDPADTSHRDAAEALGIAIAEAGIRLVYGGGATGTMGVLARACLGQGGTVVGVVPDFLNRRHGLILREASEVWITRTMHERKMMMFEAADGFIALPGGIGTLEETLEALTWAQLGEHAKPVIFLNVNGYWDLMFAMIENMRRIGYVHSAHDIDIRVVSDVQSVLQLLLSCWNGRTATS